MKTFFYFEDRPLFDWQSWDIFARLGAMFGIHYGIFFAFSFTEPLTLLRNVIFDKLKVMKTFFCGDRPLFDKQSFDIRLFARLAAKFGIHCGILYGCSSMEPLTLLRVAQGFRETHWLVGTSNVSNRQCC